MEMIELSYSDDDAYEKYIGLLTDTDDKIYALEKAIEVIRNQED